METCRKRAGESAVHGVVSESMRDDRLYSGISSISPKDRWSSLTTRPLANTLWYPAPNGMRSRPLQCRKSSSSLSLVAMENFAPCLICNFSDGTVSPFTSMISLREVYVSVTGGRDFSERISSSTDALTSFWSDVSSKIRSDFSAGSRFGKRVSNSVVGIWSPGVWETARVNTAAVRRTWIRPLFGWGKRVELGLVLGRSLVWLGVVRVRSYSSWALAELVLRLK